MKTICPDKPQTKFRKEWYIKTTIEYDSTGNPKSKHYYLKLVRVSDRKLLAVGKGDLAEFSVGYQTDTFVHLACPKNRNVILENAYMLVKL